MSYSADKRIILAHMLSGNGYSPSDISRALAERARERRLEANQTQKGLAVRSGVSLGSLKRFERTGLVSLEGLIRIALGLGASEGFERLFAPGERRTLDEIIATPPRRKRGRRA